MLLRGPPFGPHSMAILWGRSSRFQKLFLQISRNNSEREIYGIEIIRTACLLVRICTQTIFFLGMDYFDLLIPLG